MYSTHDTSCSGKGIHNFIEQYNWFVYICWWYLFLVTTAILQLVSIKLMTTDTQNKHLVIESESAFIVQHWSWASVYALTLTYIYTLLNCGNVLVTIFINSSWSRFDSLFVSRGGGALPYIKGGDACREISNEFPKRYQSGCGLSRILPLKGTNQKHRDKQLLSMNLIAIKLKSYIRWCLNEMPFSWPWHP